MAMTLTGFVFNAAGGPISGATVQGYVSADDQSSGTTAGAAVQTDPNGKWEITTSNAAHIPMDVKITFGDSVRWLKAADSINVSKLTLTDTLTVGEDDVGFDVIFYGETASANMTWDASVDDLILNGAARIVVPDGQLVLGSTAVSSTAAELNILDGVTATASELNLLDGGTSVGGSITIADSDGFVVNDGGTMKTIPASDISTYVAASVGDITGVTAGTGLSGGGTNGTVELTVAASQTSITSVHATDLIIGEDSQTAIDFGTPNEIDFKADNAARLTLTSSALYPVTNNQIDLGTSSLEFKDAYFDGTVTADAFAGPLTGDVTGNADTATVATTVTITDNESTNEDNAIIFTAGGDVDGGNIGLESDGTLTYNPSTGKITATGFIGALTGNADTATALATGRTIAMTGDVAWTSASFDGSGNVTGAGTIQSTAVESGMLNNNVISGQTEISSGLAAADELLYSDGGTLKKVGLDNFVELSPQLATEDTVAVASDYLLFLDGGATGNMNKESVADFVSAIAGSGLSASSGQLTASSGGLAMAEQYRLTSSFTGNSAPISSNLAVVNSDGYGTLGTGMTLKTGGDAGVFTFPSTGHYLITFDIFFSSAAVDYTMVGIIKTSTNFNGDKDFNAASNGYAQLASASTAQQHAHASFIFDVQATASHAVRFDIAGMDSSNTVHGDANQNYTYMTFIKLGD